MKTVALSFNVDDTPPSLEQMLRLFERDGGVALPPATLAFSTDLRVDLSDCGFLGPMAVVSLCALKRKAQLDGFAMSLVPPRHERLASYCSYSGLLSEFGLGPPPDSEHPRNVTRPVMTFVGTIPRNEIAALVTLARSQMRLSRTGEEDLKLTLSEVEQNVLDHSESEMGGVVSGRAFAERREVRFAVADLGVGFRMALKKRFEAETDVDALCARSSSTRSRAGRGRTTWGRGCSTSPRLFGSRKVGLSSTRDAVTSTNRRARAGSAPRRQVSLGPSCSLGSQFVTMSMKRKSPMREASGTGRGMAETLVSVAGVLGTGDAFEPALGLELAQHVLGPPVLGRILLDFAGVQVVSSACANAFFVALLQQRSLSDLASQMVFVNMSSRVGDVWSKSFRAARLRVSELAEHSEHR